MLPPLFPEVEAFAEGIARVFSGGGAGGFGLMAAFAALALRRRKARAFAERSGSS
jgi:hypothetical protein